MSLSIKKYPSELVARKHGGWSFLIHVLVEETERACRTKI